ncbi:succinylglutamate desuccinylase/aspartoacylase domain-containing protein [Alcaligenes sp. CHO6]|uniref:succinylglutamate desuccinylase/aspartoacylase domain-containing protein n=1 Tax=Alcaligenes sp. CHO6 TaxID=3123298 RepID=UPI0030143F92
MSFSLSYPDIQTERQGNTGVPGLWCLDSGKAGRTVMISALIHGNELCGAWALKALLARGVQPRRGKLILAFCNLDAFDRFDPAHHDASRYVDEDMNRVWSAQKLSQTQTQEQRRARAILPWLEQADWLLDLHSMHEPCAPLLLTGTLERNIELAKTLGAPEHVIVDSGHQDCVRMRDYGRFSEPEAEETRSLLLECGFHGDPQTPAVALDLIARFLIASEIVDIQDIPSDWRRASPKQQRIVQVTHAVVAPSRQVSFSQAWQGLETLSQAGTCIGQADGQPLLTPYDHCTLIMPSLRQLRPGVTVVRLARDYMAP